MPLKVLIVEDSESKGDSIESVIRILVPTVSVHRALSVKSAITSVINCEPDIIIADMSLPTFDIEVRERGGTPRPFGGIEVFETLDRHGIVIPVLVVTAYEAISDGTDTVSLKELSLRLEAEFPSCFKGAVYFDTTFSSWERELSSYLRKILEDLNGA